MRVVIFDNQVRERIAEVKEYAEAHTYSFDDLLDMKNHQKPPPGNDPGHCMIIPFGVRVVYSIEYQPELGWCHHFSFSVEAPTKLPNVPVVVEIMKHFGVDRSLQECHVSLEEEGIGPEEFRAKTGFSAVNIVTEI